MTEKARFLKKNGVPNLDLMVQSQAQNEVFCHFLKLGSLLFHEVEHDDNLQQCIKSSRGLAQFFPVQVKRQGWKETFAGISRWMFLKEHETWHIKFDGALQFVHGL